MAFAEGNRNEAEGYVSASWQLGQQSEVAEHLGQIYQKRSNHEEAMHFYALSLSTRRPEPETSQRLATLVNTEKIDSLVADKQKELLHLRTLKLRNSGMKDGFASFFVLISPGEANFAKLEAVKFLSGSETVRDMGNDLPSARFAQSFPNASSLKILRRGTLSWAATSSDCTFVLDLPEDVKSFD